MIEVKELKVVNDGKIYTFPYVDENGQDFFERNYEAIHQALIMLQDNSKQFDW